MSVATHINRIGGIHCPVTKVADRRIGMNVCGPTANGDVCLSTNSPASHCFAGVD